MKHSIFAIFFGLFSGSGNDSGKRSENPLEGFWKLHVIEAQDKKTGQWRQHRWMRNGEGYLHYDGHQYMSVHFTPEGYDTLKVSGNEAFRSLTPEELKLLASDYWYVAHYEVNKRKGIVQHRRIIHSNPEETGKLVTRRFERIEDTLILKPVEFNLRLKWIKQSM